jgi:hypothetical protein
MLSMSHWCSRSLLIQVVMGEAEDATGGAGILEAEGDTLEEAEEGTPEAAEEGTLEAEVHMLLLLCVV